MTYDIIGQNYDIIGQNYDIIVSTMISGVPRFQMALNHLDCKSLSAKTWWSGGRVQVSAPGRNRAWTGSVHPSIAILSEYWAKSRVDKAFWCVKWF